MHRTRHFASLGTFVCVLLTAARLIMGAAPAHALSSTNVVVGVRHNMQAILIAPDDPGPHPGVLVLHTSGGLEPADIEYARHLAEQGYVCLVPSFMAAYRLSGSNRAVTFTTDADQIYADFVQALDMLRGLAKVHGSKLGAIGFSNGGYFAAWLAATGKVQAAVGYYGAYTGAATDPQLNRFRAAFTASSAPLLILHGTSDGIVNVKYAKQLAAIAAAAHSPYEIHLYDGATHVFDRGDGGTPGKRMLGDRDPEVAADAWQRTLTFFGKYLKGS